MIYIIACIIGYLLGSIPFAIVIGKVFYKTDIRKHGSGNPGASNAGRVLGKKAAIAVILGDVGKVIVSIAILSMFSSTASILAGTAAAFGHCYPIFLNFKGGKAVATTAGYLIGISIFTFQSPWYVVIPLIVFISSLYITKIVSISSMLAATTSTIYILLNTTNMVVILSSIALTILIIYRHKSNIVKLMNKTENKITWM